MAGWRWPKGGAGRQTTLRRCCRRTRKGLSSGRGWRCRRRWPLRQTTWCRCCPTPPTLLRACWTTISTVRLAAARLLPPAAGSLARLCMALTARWPAAAARQSSGAPGARRRLRAIVLHPLLPAPPLLRCCYTHWQPLGRLDRRSSARRVAAAHAVPLPMPPALPRATGCVSPRPHQPPHPSARPRG